MSETDKNSTLEYSAMLISNVSPLWTEFQGEWGGWVSKIGAWTLLPILTPPQTFPPPVSFPLLSPLLGHWDNRWRSVVATMVWLSRYHSKHKSSLHLGPLRTQTSSTLRTVVFPEGPPSPPHIQQSLGETTVAGVTNMESHLDKEDIGKEEHISMTNLSHIQADYTLSICFNKTCAIIQASLLSVMNQTWLTRLILTSLRKLLANTHR